MLDWNRERKSEDTRKDNIENHAVFRGRCFKNTFVPAVVVILTAGFMVISGIIIFRGVAYENSATHEIVR